MPKVLMLARHFPPIGGAGVHRSVGTVRHIAAGGYDVTVVTGPTGHADRWNPQDPGLLDRIPPGADVHRLQGPEPARPTRRAARLERIAQRPAAWARWWVAESERVGIEAGHDADVVLASCLPYETAWAGARAAAALGKPFVADLEDPWALDEMRLEPTRVHRALELRRMRGALRTASAVIMAAPEAAIRLERAMPDLAGRVTGIPIGFEPEDFDEPPEPSDDGVFRIVHTGSMHTDLGQHLRASRRRRALLGGTVRGLDVLPRSHVFLVDAIAELLHDDPALRGRIELHLAGGLTDADRAVAERHGFVRDRGMLSHADTVALMRSADLLFLPMHDLPGRAGLIPYKTYEYLAAERPILAAVPDGDVRDMLSGVGHATLVRPKDVTGMVAALRRELERERGAPVRDGRRSEALRALDRRNSVARIAGVLDGVLERARPADAYALAG